jgi:mRNA interferase MazF
MPTASGFQEEDSWLKSDMIYTLGLHRLNLIQLKKRLYFKHCLGSEPMKRIYQCVMHGLSLAKPAQHVSIPLNFQPKAS